MTRHDYHKKYWQCEIADRLVDVELNAINVYHYETPYKPIHINLPNTLSKKVDKCEITVFVSVDKEHNIDRIGIYSYSCYADDKLFAEFKCGKITKDKFHELLREEVDSIIYTLEIKKEVTEKVLSICKLRLSNESELFLEQK